MQVFLKTYVKGFEVLPLEVRASDTVEVVKVKIQKKTKIPLNQQQLCFAGKYLKDGYTLTNYDIQAGNAIYLMQGHKGMCSNSSRV